MVGKAELPQSNRHQAMTARVSTGAESRPRTLTLTLSRFAVEGTLAVRFARSSPLYCEAGEGQGEGDALGLTGRQAAQLAVGDGQHGEAGGAGLAEIGDERLGALDRGAADRAPGLDRVGAVGLGSRAEDAGRQLALMAVE